MQRSWSRMTVPLIALSGLLAVLAVGALAAALLRGGEPKSVLDSCVVGTWQVTSYTEDVPVDSVGKVKFQSAGTGAVLRLGADGKGGIDYGAGTTFRSSTTEAGQPVVIDLVLAGTVNYGYQTADRVMSFTGVTAVGTATVTATATGKTQSEPLTASTDPAKYECAGDGLTTYTDAYRAQFTRVGRTS